MFRWNGRDEIFSHLTMKLKSLEQAGHSAVGLFTGFSDLLFIYRGTSGRHNSSPLVRVLVERASALSDGFASIFGTSEGDLAWIWRNAEKSLNSLRTNEEFFCVWPEAELKRLFFAAAWTWWYLKQKLSAEGVQVVPGDSSIEPFEGVLGWLEIDLVLPLSPEVVRRYLER